jgi:hypothetical protein
VSSNFSPVEDTMEQEEIKRIKKCIKKAMKKHPVKFSENSAKIIEEVVDLTVKEMYNEFHIVPIKRRKKG